MDIIFNPSKTLQFVEEVAKMVDSGERVVILTRLPADELFHTIGKDCAKKCGYQDMIDAQILMPEDDGIYTFIGRMILDNLIPEDYFIMTGKGKREKFVVRVNKAEE